MKILRIIASADLANGGPIEGIFRVGQEMVRHGHTQDLMTLDPPDAPFLATAPAQIFAMGGALAAGTAARAPLWKRPGFSTRAIPWLRAHRREYDIVIVSGLWNFAPMAARWALAGSDTPYVVFTHGMLDPWFNETYPSKAMVKQAVWLVNEGPLLAHAARVLFTSEEEMLRARNVFRPYRVRGQVVAYGTADPAGAGDPAAQIACFRAQLPALGDRRFLLFLSRIHEKKGCDLLVDAFAEVAAAHPDVDLVVAGPDQVALQARLQAQAESYGIAGRLHWPGMLKGDAKWGAFHACEAFVLPSHQENFGIVVAEAMACQRPVLITDKVNIWREVKDAGAGFVSPDTAAGIADLLARFLALDASTRAEMGARARTCFVEKFDVANAARDLIGVLEDVIVAAAPGVPAKGRAHV